MRVEDVSVAAAELFFSTVLDRLELAAREPYSRTKTAAFTFEIWFSNFRAIDLTRAFLKTQHAAEHDTIRNTQALAPRLAYRARNLPAVVFPEFIEVAREETNDRVEGFLFVFTSGRSEEHTSERQSHSFTSYA